MHRTHITNGILWATAIIAAASTGAPQFLTLVLLPALGAASVILLTPKRTQRGG